jgi:hypothetical protein
MKGENCFVEPCDFGKFPYPVSALLPPQNRRVTAMPYKCDQTLNSQSVLIRIFKTVGNYVLTAGCKDLGREIYPERRLLITPLHFSVLLAIL